MRVVHDVHLQSPDEVLEALELPRDEWIIEVRDLPARQVTRPDGQQGVLVDSVLRLRRRGRNGAPVAP